MFDFAYSRRQMIERQIAARGIRDERVIAAMGRVPREAFVRPDLQEFAYDDTPLPIAEGQTISQPYIVALMIEAADIKPGDKVLEIGTGSGYAAAVLAEMGAQVLSIERQNVLAEGARTALGETGYDNVLVRTGDGTLGWPEAAPFDAILAAAGGPSVPQSWKDQLKVGGRLVMPVGDTAREQTLLRITRRSESEFSQEALEGVRFVPLIGDQGWQTDERTPAPAATRQSLPERIRSAAEPLPDFEDEAFGSLFDRFADKRVVMLGEASHGTSEFYRARAAITRRLIEKHGFTIVAVEADWPDAASVDRYVRHRPARAGAEPPFRRFPTWMWRNTDVEAFTEWMRRHNEPLPADARAGFYGLDMYNLSGSISAVLHYLEQVDPEAAKAARERSACLTPWQKDPAAYGRAVLTQRLQDCEDDVVAQLRDLLSKRLDYAQGDGDQFLDAQQNARLIASAERYYRIMYYGGAESWNLRDTHMFETLSALLEAKGPEAKAVVWAHNSHIGNAAFTEMGVIRDELNIGQLVRERFGSAAALIGMGTHTGTVACATDWDDPMEIKRVRPSHQQSYERLCHDAGLPRFLLDMGEKLPAALPEELDTPLLERFFGDLYRPESEMQSHYADASLPRQFDAYLWFDETSAVTPLPTKVREGAEETYPFGL
jgi:protein-L-isoaspartate(D-aspartate) O-methyltransferase